MPINPTPSPTKSQRAAKRFAAVEYWLDDHADVIALLLIGLILGYIIGVNV